MGSRLNDSVLVVTGSDGEQFGTGFVIYKDDHSTYLLTCMHVVSAVGVENLKVAEQYASIVASDLEDNFDLCIIKVDAVLEFPELKLRIHDSAEASVTIFGYHQSGRLRIRSDLEAILVKSAELYSKKYAKHSKCWHLVVDGDNHHLDKGFSGGPIIDKSDDCVIGIVNQRKGDGKKGLAISVEALKEVWEDMPSGIMSVVKPQEHQILAVNESGPLMNFDKELASFEDIVANRDTQTRLISVYGPSSMGKSRLLREYKRLSVDYDCEMLSIDFKQQIDVEVCLQLIVDKFGLRHFSNCEQFLCNGRPEPLTREKEREWNRNLTRKFFLDLDNLHSDSHLVLFFDHYEKSDKDVKDWLNNAFLASNFRHTPIITVVAGQDELSVDRSWTNQRRFHLDGVSVDCYYRYVKQCKVSIDPEDIKKYHAVLRGSPGPFVTFVQGLILKK